MSYLNQLEEEKRIREEEERLKELCKKEIFVINDLIQKFGWPYWERLYEFNKLYSEDRNYETIIRPIPIEKED